MNEIGDIKKYTAARKAEKFEGKSLRETK